ncbi:MAG: translation initiation factor IF-2 associated domain-containing protein, partial [Pseudomonadota bacterium]
MDGNEKTGGTMRTRGAGAGPGGPSRVKQSFSHGRSKSVVVETKKKRVLKPKDDAARPAAPAAKPAAAKPAAAAPAETAP